MVAIKELRKDQNPTYEDVPGQDLGSGSFGYVRKVKDPMTGEFFAKKVMYNRPRLTPEKMKETLRKEIKAIEAVQEHHHFIRVCAAYEYVGGAQFCLIVQPVAKGGSLDYYLSPSAASSSVSMLERAFGCLANALAYMHSKKIRHKDIKPDNILIHEGNVLWSDFGLAYDSSQLPNSITNELAVGNKLCRAPEVVDGGKKRSKADVFSLGCVFIAILFALEGRQCPNPGNIFALNMHNLWDQMQALCPRSGSRRGFLVDIIRGMTITDPDRRWSANNAFTAISANPGFCCDRCLRRIPGDSECDSDSSSASAMGSGLSSSSIGTSPSNHATTSVGLRGGQGSSVYHQHNGPMHRANTFTLGAAHRNRACDMRAAEPSSSTYTSYTGSTDPYYKNNNTVYAHSTDWNYSGASNTYSNSTEYSSAYDPYHASKQPGQIVQYTPGIDTQSEKEPASPWIWSEDHKRWYRASYNAQGSAEYIWA